MRQTNRQCIVWGATGQAKVASDILIEEGAKILHFFDNNADVRSPLPGIPISYGTDGLLRFIETLRHEQMNPSQIDCIAAIGGSNGEAREAITKLMENHGFSPRSLIHKSAIISSTASTGKSVQILAGAIIGPFTSIGDNTIVNSGANVDHDCKIGKNCHLGPRAALAGEITLEDNVFIGTNATILPKLRICAKAIVGAGAVVTKEVQPGDIVIGNPSRRMEIGQRS